MVDTRRGEKVITIAASGHLILTHLMCGTHEHAVYSLRLDPLLAGSSGLAYSRADAVFQTRTIIHIASSLAS